MKDSQKHIKLKFNCQEDPESMTKTANGDFCSACQKEVIDFTKVSISEIQEIRSREDEMCGQFRVEQIETHLRPIEVPKVRSLAFLSTILLSLNFTSASAQSTVDPKVEQSKGASNAPNLTPEEAMEKAERGQHISMSKAETKADTPKEKTLSKKELKARKRRIKKLKKKWYWSKRFPFLHRKRRRVYGMMVRSDFQQKF